MKNAFTVLGATPYDNIECLSELLEEKQLISDNDLEIQEAYMELTNPKKRIAQEVVYFADSLYSSLESIANKNYKETPTVGEVAHMLIALGKWFDGETYNLLKKINDARSSIKLPNIDESFLQQALDIFFSECVDLMQSYFSQLDERALAGIFNSIVKIKDYESYFIDELMIKYESTIKETLKEKEKKCTESFNAIEQICNSFIQGNSLTFNLMDKITSFESDLKNWDKYAQPLQVNAQLHGWQHEESFELVFKIRNKIIDLCNRSQKSLERLIQQLNMYNFQARELLPEKLSDSVEFTNQLIRLIDILLSVFAELEITAEQLKKDKQALHELYDSLFDMNNKIQSAVSARKYREEHRDKAETLKGIISGAFVALFFIVLMAILAALTY